MSQSYSNAGHAVACSRFLPAPLIEARASTFNPLNCQDLNITARRVLYGVLTFVNLRNTDREIFPRRDTLRAESLLQSDSSLYRGLAVLEAKGYIRRSQRRNQRNGKFYLSPIWLTEKALVLLGLAEVIHKAPSSKVTGGHKEKELTKDLQSFQKTACTQNSKENGLDPKTRLPVDLVSLLDLGVRKSAVCWLMGQAKHRGKRLSDVYATVKANVQGLTGRSVVAYLVAMISKDIDFAWVAREAEIEGRQQSAIEAAREKLATLDARYNGFEVIDDRGTVLGTFLAAAPGQLGTIVSAAGSMPANLRFAMAWAEGRVRFASQRVRAHGICDERDEF